jgi:hypothetical protein
LDRTLLTQQAEITSDTTGGALLGYGAISATQFEQVAFLASGLSEGVQVTMGPQPGVVEVRATVSHALADGTGQVDDSIIFTLTTAATAP